MENPSSADAADFFLLLFWQSLKKIFYNIIELFSSATIPKGNKRHGILDFQSVLYYQ